MKINKFGANGGESCLLTGVPPTKNLYFHIYFIYSVTNWDAKRLMLPNFFFNLIPRAKRETFESLVNIRGGAQGIFVNSQA